ncbi:MAG: hypothetical protein EOM21_19155 [Gammaproteobacteria bacterium]|nr:hypothetical protein [Gammaproteobacteria bacterium]
MSSSGAHPARFNPSGLFPGDRSGFSFSGAAAQVRREAAMYDPTTIERNLHVEEIKVRLKPGDAELVRALALKLDIPVAVLMRRLVLHSLESRELSASLRAPGWNGRAH